MSYAHVAVYKAVQQGLLAPIRSCACEHRECDQRADIYHHPDYTYALYVIPLCFTCHSQIHRGLIREPRTDRLYPHWSIKQAEHTARARRWKARQALLAQQSSAPEIDELERLRTLHGMNCG